MIDVRHLIYSNRGFLIFLLAFGLIRGAVADYNPVPSGSMHPTILEGDVVLVNRLAYDLKIPLTKISLVHLGDPRRGDIVTFFSPADGTRLIKRVIGLPGDVIAMRDKRLTINGTTVSYGPSVGVVDDLGANRAVPGLRLTERLGAHPYEIQWLLGLDRASGFGPLLIPADRYLMLGDNRDDSADSRFIGLVPRELVIGRAERILASASMKTNWMPRFDRFGKTLYP
jgi:signal peptidase I